jgi:chromatin remodeling complex protein RSC6
VDAALAAIIGREAASRAQISRLLWNYAKAHHLQNPHNGRRIVPDATLATVVGIEGEEMDGFTMMKYVKHHILKDDQRPPRP